MGRNVFVEIIYVVFRCFINILCCEYRNFMKRLANEFILGYRYWI